MDYYFHLLLFLAVITVMAYALNIPMGYGGALAFCSALLTGVGAYACTLLTCADSPNVAGLILKKAWLFGMRCLWRQWWPGESAPS